jgi:hypothetical protein
MQIIQFLGVAFLTRNRMRLKILFLEDLVLFITKEFFHLNINCHENMWMHRLTLRLDPKLIFPFHKIILVKSFHPWLIFIWTWMWDLILMPCLQLLLHLICGWIGAKLWCVIIIIQRHWLIGFTMHIHGQFSKAFAMPFLLL